MPTDTVSRDVRFIQHPFLVLVLLVAGASVEFSPVALGLGASYIALRALGKWVGGFLVKRVAGVNAPHHSSAIFSPPAYSVWPSR